MSVKGKVKRLNKELIKLIEELKTEKRQEKLMRNYINY